MVVLDLNKDVGLLDLTKESPTLKVVEGILNWDENPIHKNSLSQGFDLDIFAYVLDSNEKIQSGSDVVYFNNKSFNSGAVSVPVDNRTGQGDNDETIFIDSVKFPSNKKFVDVYVFIHDAVQRQQTFGMMTNSSFILKNKDNGETIVKYNLSTYTNETVIHVGRFEVDSGSMKFTPSGEAANSDPNQVAQAYM